MTRGRRMAVIWIDARRKDMGCSGIVSIHCSNMLFMCAADVPRGDIRPLHIFYKTHNEEEEKTG